MGWFNDDSEQANAYNEVMNAPHKAKLSHELIAAAASYEAAKAYEHHIAKHGRPPSHEKAKEIFAGLAGGFADRLIETKGMDFIDRERVKHDAMRHAQHSIASGY
ncbi:hypothetical protein V8B97DRAFT_1916095 [Scleroderma yunnanense]